MASSVVIGAGFTTAFSLWLYGKNDYCGMRIPFDRNDLMMWPIAGGLTGYLASLPGGRSLVCKVFGGMVIGTMGLGTIAAVWRDYGPHRGKYYGMHSYAYPRVFAIIGAIIGLSVGLGSMMKFTFGSRMLTINW
jgi:hypothetical protein